MRPLLRVLVGVGLSAVVPCSAIADSPGVPDAAGVWRGILKAPKGDLILFLRIRRQAPGELAGELSVPQQGLLGLPLEETRAEEETLSFRVPSLQASYAATVEARSMTGTWSQPLGSLPLVFRRTAVEEVPDAVFRRPQTPRPPFPFRAEEVKFGAADRAVTLAGTLTVPAGHGPFPAAILLSVAGPNDRDQSYAGHRPFLILADYLTRRGIAVLRWDGRGVGGSTGRPFQATVSDLADDAVAGLRFLAERLEIDPRKIGFIGNSEGGEVGALAATRSDAAFVVMLAGPGLPGEASIRVQTIRLAELAGESPAQIAEVELQAAKRLSAILSSPDAATLRRRLVDIAAESRAPLPRAAVLTTGGLDAEVAMDLSPWFQSELRYDPLPALGKLRIPVLALTGSLDPVLPADKHLPEILKALLTGRDTDVTVAVVPGVNHLFQPAKTGLPQEYFGLDQTFSTSVLDRVAVWITSRFAAR